MQPRDPDPAQWRPAVWPANAEIGRPHAPKSAPTYCYLLDADSDLADAFDLRMRIVARQVATVRVLDVAVGECDLEPALRACGTGPDLLVLDGVLAVEIHVGDRAATELLGAGDLLQPREEGPVQLLEHTAAWRVLVAGRLGVLDEEFAERVRPWPPIADALLRRADRRARDLGMQRAIAAQPRLEVRLALLLWHLAGRWGRVEPGGIRLTLPLTHALLGRLVGAERPSVSHALARLADAGLVTGGAGDWHLRGTPQDHVETLVERHVRRMPSRLGPGRAG